ncbi:MAG TPA: toll/interleukin-1 receptor domain-containing protein, partial [Ilumatobacteraceae bacterium]
AELALEEKDHRTVQRWVADFYKTYDTESDTLTKLAELPFRLVINTSAGLSALNAFTAAKPKTYGDFYEWKGAAKTHLPTPTADEPVVYGLFGSLQQPSSLPLTELDRLDFLVSVIGQNPPLPVTLTGWLQDPNNTFLFLGFNLRQWQLRILVHVLGRKAQRPNRSFALELADSGLDDETRHFYRVGHRVEFVDMPLDAFVAQLHALVPPDGVTSAAVTGTLDTLRADAPTVFVCHVHEDKAAAQRLAGHLRANGLRPWFDEDLLDAGEDIDYAIERAIEKEIQYFVVVQSANLARRSVDAYANKEIKLALKRNERNRRGMLFIIPVSVDGDDNTRLEEFEGLLTVDISTTKGMDLVVRSIMRDLDEAVRTR